MGRNAAPAPSNEVRIRQLESLVESLAAKLDQTRRALANSSDVRLAKVTDNPTASDDLEPIKFVRVTHDGGFSGGGSGSAPSSGHTPGTVTLTERSASQQAAGARYKSPPIPRDAIVPVFRNEANQWIHLPPTGGFGRLNEVLPAMDDAADKPGTASLSVHKIDAAGKIVDTGLDVTVKNLFDADIPAGSIVRFHLDYYGEPLVDCCFGTDSQSVSGSQSITPSGSQSVTPSGSQSVTPSGSGGVCVLIPGVDLGNLPVVSADAADYVLGVQDGCLVAIDLAACITGSGSV